MTHAQPWPRSRGRVQPAADLADRLPVRQALPLVLVETLGLGTIFAIYGVLDARDSVLAPLLVPFAVSFILYLALPAAKAKTPRQATPWIERAMLEVGTLPPKKPKPAKKTSAN